MRLTPALFAVAVTLGVACDASSTATPVRFRAECQTCQQAFHPSEHSTCCGVDCESDPDDPRCMSCVDEFGDPVFADSASVKSCVTTLGTEFTCIPE